MMDCPSILSQDRYWLQQAQVPLALLAPASRDWQNWLNLANPDGLVQVDLAIAEGKIVQMVPSGANSPDLGSDLGIEASLNLQGKQLWPCFVDLHTHLDKGHIWNRAPNPDGSFDQALATVHQDAQTRWTQEDVLARMEFGLKCSYGHGTQGIRTHLDSAGKLAEIVWPAFGQLRDQWSDRLTLQAVSLVSLADYLTDAGEALADRVADWGGILGAVVFPHPDLQLGLDRLFQLAQERHLDLDLHVDESSNPADHVLGKVATAKLRHNFTGQVVCGHCCTLALQPPEMMAQTIAQVKAAQIAIVSLPLCNLYLQDRQADRTPRWRGVTALHELNQAQVPVVLASDNCRDPFYGFGDHDGLEVFRESVRIAHLDRPYSQWPQAVTRTPAQLMASAEGTMAGSKMTGEMIGRGIIGEGVAADFIVFAGRGFSELLSRCQHDRWVIRRGRAIATTLPDYSDLDRYMT